MNKFFSLHNIVLLIDLLIEFHIKYNSPFRNMNEFIQKIDIIVSNANKEINNKIIGINYLEKIKYILIDNLKNFNETILNNLSVELENNKVQINNILIR